MRKIVALICLVGLVSMILPGCGSHESVISGGKVTIKMLATKNYSSISLASGRVMGDTVVFSQALLGVGKLELKTMEQDERDSADFGHDDDRVGSHGEGDDEGDGDGGTHSGDSTVENHHDDEGEIEFKGPFVFDLITGTSTPSFDIKPGLFNEIEVETAPVLPDGNSVSIAFQVTTGTDTFKVAYSTRQKIEIEIKRKEGIQVDANSLSQILVTLHLDKLIGSIDFSQAMVGSDGVIRISETSNTSLFNLIKQNLRGSFEAGEDDDHDGEIDDD